MITSNRDEKVIRPSAIMPRNYKHKGKNMMYPKDSKAGEPGLSWMKTEQFWFC